MYAILDVVTIAPVVAQPAMFLVFEARDPVDNGRAAKQYYLMVIRVLRALRLMRAYRLLVFTSNAIQRQLWTVGLTVLSLIVCTTGAIQALEYDPDPMSKTGQSLAFLDAM